MPRLPRVCGREARRAFEQAGWAYVRTTGDHMMLRAPAHRTLVIPDYPSLSASIVRGLLRTAGISVEQFIDLLGR